ncbi:MAG: hypothetical protein QM786_09220 [Breznakibacter sp.]
MTKTRQHLSVAILPVLLAVCLTARAQYVTRVFEFMPAPGQFTNTSIATASAAANVTGSNDNMVSLGSFGGYVVVGFDRPIVNDPQNPYGVDFSVAGNSFAGNAYGQWCEPGAVQVMKDLNGDGLPNDGEWYELAGSDYWLSSTKRNITVTYYNPHYTKGYAVPWRADNGDYGALVANRFHTQPYYPDPFDFGTHIIDSVSFTGTRIRGNIDMSSPSYLNPYRAPAFGYCDSKGNNSPLTSPKNPYTAGTDGFDLSWAVDKDGNHVELDMAHFVKIYNAGFANIGWLGEWSTEVLKVAVTDPDPGYVPQDYYRNYIGITQLQVLKGQTCQYDGILFKNGRPVADGTPRWWTSNPSVGTVDNEGNFTALGLGETKLYFSQKDDIPADSIPLKVVELKRVVLEMEGNNSAISSDSSSLLVNEKIYIIGECEDNRTEVLNATVANRFVYEPLVWTTSNPAAGTIDNGLFTATAPGRTKVYARSSTNPALADSILVIVKPLPEVKPVKELVKIPSFAATGTFNPSDLFTTGTDAEIILNTAIPDAGNMGATIRKNVFGYGFTPGEYTEDVVHFNITVFGQTHDFDITFSYMPATFPADKQLLFVYEADGEPQAVKAWLPDTGATNTVATYTDGETVADMQVDGAFLFVATGKALYRYNLSTYEAEQVSGIDYTPHKLRILANRLFVTGTRDGASSVYAYFKSDLTPSAIVGLPAPAVALAAADGKVYAVTSGATVSALVVLEAGLGTVSLAGTTDWGTDGLTVTDLVPYNGTLYAVRKGGDGIVPAVISVKTTDGARTVTEIAGVEFPSGNITAMVEPMAGSTLLLKNKRGFTPFDTGTLTLSASTYMRDNTRYATGGTYDPDTKQYYVSHTGSSGNRGSVFSSAYALEANFTGLGDNPAILRVCPKLAENERPEATTAIAASSAVERKTGTVMTVSKATSFSDVENNFTIYPKSTPPFVTWTRSGDNLRYSVFFDGFVTADSTITLEVEAIDHYGCATTGTFALTIRPRIYTPRISTPLVARSVDAGTEELRLSLGETFEFFTANVSARHVKSVHANTNPMLVTAAIDTEADELVLSFAPGQTGNAVVTLRGTTVETSPDDPEHPESKYVEMPVSVTVTSVATGIGKNVAENGPVVYPTRTRGIVYVKLGQAQPIRVRNLSGTAVHAVPGHEGLNTLGLGHLPNGLYFIQTDQGAAKVLLAK